MKSKHLTLKIFLLIALNDLTDGVAQLFMKKGIIHTGIASVGFSNIFDFAALAVRSPLVWVGIAIGVSNFFLWLIILYRLDLSVAMPVGSFIYIFVPLMSVFFLHERVGLLRWSGILLIIGGIHLVAKSVPKKGDHTINPC